MSNFNKTNVCEKNKYDKNIIYILIISMNYNIR